MDIKTMEQQIADFYGFYSQSRMCTEEAAELIQAVCKYCRAIIYYKDEYGEDISSRQLARLPEFEHLIEELADTRIMIDQLEHLLGCEKPVHAVMFNKLARTISQIEEERE